MELAKRGSRETLPAAGDMMREPMARRGVGRKGQPIKLLTNHVIAAVAKSDGHFFHYSISITYEDGSPVDAKGIGRKVVDKVWETYGSELSGKHFAYDGEKSLFTVGPLPGNILDFEVLLDEVSSHRAVGKGSPEAHGSPQKGDTKRFRRQQRSKTYKVSINYAAKVPIQAIVNALNGNGNKTESTFQEAVRVLDIILRQHASKQGCLLVRQSFFHNEPRNFTDLGGGVVGCRGFHSSFRATQGGLSLNIDVSTTMIVKPGPVIDFLLANQNVQDHRNIDWIKAKRMLKNLRIRNTTTNAEHKIIGLSERSCIEETFTLKQRKEDGSSHPPILLTVYEYFASYRKIPLGYSKDLPCINVGKPKRPTFIPIEHCVLVSLQRYTKALTNLQRASLVEKSRQKPQDRMRTLNEALRISNYNADPMLGSAGVTISNQFTSLDGRVLPAPRLQAGNEEIFPRNGRWNFNNKKLADPVKIERWAVVNFSARVNMEKLIVDLRKCAESKGITLLQPYCVFEEDGKFRRNPAPYRVDKMFEEIMETLPKVPDFLLCILPERKNSDLYGPWKRKNLSELGIVTQCIAPTKINDQYLTNVILKINAKMGGLNSILSLETQRRLPVVSRVPTLIVGMDVSHGSPGRADVPSIAAIVSSRGWPLISRYRAVVRAQPPKTEMVDTLYQKVGDNDGGIFRELLLDFYLSTQKQRPDQIIIFRDGVSESQFNQVLNIEFDQILQACKHMDETWSPKFTILIAQKNHHTKFFQPNSADNVPPGTVVDTGICHARNNDFYMCAHAGMIGTSRPTHYHVLHDEIGFSADDIQELVNSLSYVYQRSTTAISIVAPILYAHLAASQVSQFIKFDDLSDAASSHDGVTSTTRPFPQLPKLDDHVSSTMFFC